MNTQLIEIAKSQRGQGWLGAMQIVDTLDAVGTTNHYASEVKFKMENEIGRIILSGS